MLKRLRGHSAICCFEDEELVHKYSITGDEEGRCVEVLRWGGLTYIVSDSLEAIGVQADSIIPMECMKHSEVLVELLEREGVTKTSSFVNLIDIVDVVAQQGRPQDFIEELLCL